MWDAMTWGRNFAFCNDHFLIQYNLYGKVQNMDPRSMDPLSGPGPWTPSMDWVHGPPPWTESMDPLHGPHFSKFQYYC